MFLFAAAAFFAVFLLNVIMGAFAGAAFLGDLGEMLCLLAAATAFVAAVLRREAAARAEAGKNNHGQ